MKSNPEHTSRIIQMPATSQAQQKFMGMVHAYKKGEKKNASPAVKKAAKSMSDKDAKDFASTPHKGLPKKVDESLEDKLRQVFFGS